MRPVQFTPFYFILFSVQLLRRQPALSPTLREIKEKVRVGRRSVSMERWKRRAMGRRRMARERHVGLN